MEQSSNPKTLTDRDNIIASQAAEIEQLKKDAIISDAEIGIYKHQLKAMPNSKRYLHKSLDWMAALFLCLVCLTLSVACIGFWWSVAKAAFKLGQSLF